MKKISRYFITFILILFYANACMGSFEIKNIEFKGIYRISSNVLQDKIHVKVGDKFNTIDSSTIIQDLYNTHYFKDVKVSYSEYEGLLTIYLQEQPIISDIKFTDKKNRQLKDILKRNELEKGRFLDEVKLKLIANEIKLAYLMEGFENTTVDIEQQELEGNQVSIKIDIKRGSFAKIKHIVIIGNKDFARKTLLANISAREIYNSILDHITSSVNYTENTLLTIVSDLKTFYFNHGYIDFRVKSHNVDFSDDQKVCNYIS